MKINKKDRGQILRMAGNIAPYSGKLAIEILEETDRQIQERNKD